MSSARACGACRHFDADPASLERRVPGLRTLSSGAASVRDRDGICQLNERFVSATSSCASFAVRTALAVEPAAAAIHLRPEAAADKAP
jgi:hypothetical protein